MAWLFTPGRCVATRGALDVGARLGDASLAMLVNRHLRGDWGDVDDDDRKANDQAEMDGERILSVYGEPGSPDRLYVLTEADRSMTTIMRPDEY